MAMYDVTPENMRGIANQIESLATDYGNLYNNNLLQQLVGEDLAEAYKGTDAQALTNRLNDYRIPFEAMKKQLIEYAFLPNLPSVTVSVPTEPTFHTSELKPVGRVLPQSSAVVRPVAEPSASLPSIPPTVQVFLP